MTDPRFAFAQARMQARHANRPGGEDWRRLAASQGVEPLLDAARGTSLEQWVRSVPRNADARSVEAELVAAFRAHVDEVAGWVPDRWASAVRWIQWLPLLPRLESSSSAEIESGLIAPLFGAGAARAWLERWLELSPRRDELAPLIDAGRSHLRAMAELRDQESGWPLRLALAKELERVLRRRAVSPAAVFAFLGLGLLEVERLRAAIIVRAAMGPEWRESAWV